MTYGGVADSELRQDPQGTINVTRPHTPDPRLAPAARLRRFFRERELALVALLELRPFEGRRLEVEVRGQREVEGRLEPELAVMWEAEVPVAARLGLSVVFHYRTGQALQEALAAAAHARGLRVDLLPERDLWRVVAH